MAVNWSLLNTDIPAQIGALPNPLNTYVEAQRQGEQDRARAAEQAQMGTLRGLQAQVAQQSLANAPQDQANQNQAATDAHTQVRAKWFADHAEELAKTAKETAALPEAQRRARFSAIDGFDAVNAGDAHMDDASIGNILTHATGIVQEKGLQQRKADEAERHNREVERHQLETERIAANKPNPGEGPSAADKEQVAIGRILRKGDKASPEEKLRLAKYQASITGKPSGADDYMRPTAVEVAAATTAMQADPALKDYAGNAAAQSTFHSVRVAALRHGADNTAAYAAAKAAVMHGVHDVANRFLPGSTATYAPTLDTPTAPSVATPASAGGKPAVIKSDAEYNSLPSGAHFVGPDGHERIKP